MNTIESKNDSLYSILSNQPILVLIESSLGPSSSEAVQMEHDSYSCVNVNSITMHTNIRTHGEDYNSLTFSDNFG